MSLLYIDSFDTYGTSQLGTRGWTADSQIAITASAGRRGTSALRLGPTSGTRSIRRTIATGSTFIVGAAVRSSTIGTMPSGWQIFALVDPGGATQVDLRVLQSGYLYVTRNGTTLATATDTTLLDNTYYYIEFKVTINNAAGSFSVRVNGVQVGGLTVSGVDTQASGSYSTADRLWISVPTTGATVDYDDLYVCNNAGATNNDFLGDCKVEAINPTAEGTYSEWTPSSGADNAALVDDAASPDDDSTFVSSQTLNVRDTYLLQDLATATGTVYGVQSVLRARKDDAGTRKIRPLFRRAGVDATGAEVSLSDTYVSHLEIFETDPTNAAAWNIANVNALEFGAKLTT
jgi:hypothetical protein